MKANTVAAAVVLWSPDKTIRKYSPLCVLSLSLFPSSRSHLCLSSNNPPVFLPVSMSTVQSGPNLIASLRPFVLSRATGEQLLNVVHMVPGRLSWMHYQALKRRSCCTERLAMCELMSLSNPLYLKVLIGALFHFVAISWDTTDAFCLLRHSKMIFIVSDSSFLKFSLCVLFWECIQSNESISLQSKTNVLLYSCYSNRSF